MNYLKINLQIIIIALISFPALSVTQINGEGFGASLASAKQDALGDIANQIAVTVNNNTELTASRQSTDDVIDVKESFDSQIKTSSNVELLGVSFTQSKTENGYKATATLDLIKTINAFDLRLQQIELKTYQIAYQYINQHFDSTKKIELSDVFFQQLITQKNDINRYKKQAKFSDILKVLAGQIPTSIDKLRQLDQSIDSLFKRYSESNVSSVQHIENIITFTALKNEAAICKTLNATTLLFQRDAIKNNAEQLINKNLLISTLNENNLMLAVVNENNKIVNQFTIHLDQSISTLVKTNSDNKTNLIIVAGKQAIDISEIIVSNTVNDTIKAKTSLGNKCDVAAAHLSMLDTSQSVIIIDTEFEIGEFTLQPDPTILKYARGKAIMTQIKDGSLIQLPNWTLEIKDFPFVSETMSKDKIKTQLESTLIKHITSISK
ncbi:LPP20 family lipoprotein [Algibacillus agarilyticus]|uniref:LPP20 family lipoprotein n=1 Tax=Algibacillus agarilyticus TaxID=2234133 RepID=UPI000DD076C2|nr:LPP20 family lipoprotein [Algibacillus agarilyticus]